MRLLMLAVLTLQMNSQIVGQNSQELEAYNLYISFLNECTHGLAIAKTLLDNNNKELNRYIDLPTANTIDINNDDLPSNYFDKPDDDSEFYEVSPIELSRDCKERSNSLNPKIAKPLNNYVDKIVSILNQINQIRFDIEVYIRNHDLNEKESIYGVYEYLEKAVKLFNDYSSAHNNLFNKIQAYYRHDPDDKLHEVCQALHTTTKSILRNMRRENESNVTNNISKLSIELENFINYTENNIYDYTSDDSQYYIKSIRDKTTKIIQLVKNYHSPGYVPVELELYGKQYYYHNQLLSKYFNFTGPGFVRDINKLFKHLDKSFIYFDEEPLLFKVIYPVKVLEAKVLKNKKKLIRKSNPIIENKLEFSNVAENRKAPTSTTVNDAPIESEKTIINGKNQIVLEIYDCNMQDKDSIKIVFNGKVILDQYQMQMKAETFNLELDPNGPNTIVVTALNDGIIAPNTPSISYRKSGKRKKTEFRPDLLAQENVVINIE